ncbi:hypothetical protein H2508_04575 [Parahaliea sp. F7430]|uniref:Uncharacterized protein n=1 Tax=Sediminihaliea albiluteola TaxID=2758564 RepID=A0A7W2TUV0_9GAMM|nr:hypothetical protein [Sediminihaliea albiluteola]MBA6412381.1 hypothetical protein [Sediminihaliea albiluteola]
MIRLALVCDLHSISSGVFFNRHYAEQAAVMLEGEFPGTTWLVVVLPHGLKPEGYKHLGEHGARRKLKRITTNDKEQGKTLRGQ